MTRVLVIDDEPAIADVLRMLLEFRGHEVLVANDGSRGYATAQRQAPDVIVLDLMMPVMDGFATFDALQSDERTEAIPVVILSALSSAEVKQRCHDKLTPGSPAPGGCDPPRRVSASADAAREDTCRATVTSARVRSGGSRSPAS
jgi:CheY-like chemotaxis protein